MGRQILFLLTFYIYKQTWPHMFCLLLQFLKKKLHFKCAFVSDKASVMQARREK